MVKKAHIKLSLFFLVLTFIVGCDPQGERVDQPLVSEAAQRSDYLLQVEKVDQAELLLNEVGVFFDPMGSSSRVDAPAVDSPYASLPDDELKVFRKDRLSDFIEKSKTLTNQYIYQVDTSQNDGSFEPSDDPAVIKLHLAEDLDQSI